MADTAVADPPSTSTDTGADLRVTAGEGDTGAASKDAVQTPSVQTGAGPKDATADPSSPDTSKADDTPDTAAETPEARLAREKYEADVEVKAQELAQKQASEAKAKAEAEDRQRKADERKVTRTNAKSTYTRSLSEATRIATEKHGLTEEQADEILNPVRAAQLRNGSLLDNEYESARLELLNDVYEIERDLVPADKQEGLEEAIKAQTDHDYVKKVIAELAEAYKTMPLEDILKANPKARGAALTVEQIRSLVPAEARESYDKTVGKSTNVIEHLKAWGDHRFEEGLKIPRGQPGSGSNGNTAAAPSQPLTVEQASKLPVAELVARRAAATRS